MPKGLKRRILKHWRAYQKTAIRLKCWRFRFLLHDLDKVILLLLGVEKSKVSKLHRVYSTHHVRNKKIIDPLAAVIDWECARFTKPEKPQTAKEFTNDRHPDMLHIFNPIFEKLGLVA